jgi:hypothetical protein
MADEHENVLPAAVRRQAEMADKLLEEMNKAPEDDEQTEAPPEDPKAEAKPEEKSDPDPKEAPAAKGGEETFEKRYKVLQGKYNAEVPRLQKQLREANDKEAELRQRLTNLETLVASMKDKPAKEESTPVPESISQEEIEQFGPDLIDVVRRVVRQESGVILDKRLKPVEENVKQVSENVASTTETVAQSDRRRMFDELQDAVPNWQQQNEDPDFLTWLEEEDPYSGMTRQSLLVNALKANNSTRVIALFRGFQQENAVVTPDDQESEKAPSKEDSESPDELNDLVAPGTPKTGTTGAQDESGKGMIWTRRDIEQFTAEKNEWIKRNPEKDMPEKLQKLDRDLFAAQIEGRVRL